MERPELDKFVLKANARWPSRGDNGKSKNEGLSHHDTNLNLRRRGAAAEDVDDFSCRVGLAVDVGFVGVGCGVAGDNHVELVKVKQRLFAGNDFF